MPKKASNSSIELLKNLDQESMVSKADFYLKKNKINNAKEILESIRILYPYTESSEWAIIHLVNIYKKQKKYDELINVSSQFIDQSSNQNKDLEYISFVYCDAFFNKMIKMHTDADNIQKTINVLELFLDDFTSKSKYYNDIYKKLEIAKGRLVFHELEIGTFYEKKSNFLAALKRYLNAYNISSKNIYSDEILYRIYFSYKNIGLDKESEKYFNELINNFPESNKFVKLVKILNKKNQ